MNLNRLMLVLALSLSCIGCSRFSQSTSDLYVPGENLLKGKGEGYEARGVHLTIEPSRIDLCEHPDGRVSAFLRWKVARRGVQNVDIWISEKASRPKKLVTGSASGSSETGNWVTGGTTFRMTDSAAGKTLALWKVYAESCLASR